MPCRLAFVFAAGLLFLATESLPAQSRGFGRNDPQPAQYGWLSSLEAGKSQARQTGKPLMVVLRCVP